MTRHLRPCAGREKISVEKPGHAVIEKTAPLSGLVVALRPRVYLVLRREDYEFTRTATHIWLSGLRSRQTFKLIFTSV